MNDSESNNPNVQSLACIVDFGFNEMPSEGYYRFLVDGKQIKYVEVAPELIGEDDDDYWTTGHVVVSKLLPPFPQGDWNRGYVTKDPETGEAAFVETERVFLPEVSEKMLWHPVTLNELDFKQVRRLKQQVWVVTHPEVNNGKPILFKFAVWPWEIPAIEAETYVYGRINDLEISPRFLGHVTEGQKDGRVIGFVTEWIQDGSHAGAEDLASCKKVLRRLHKLGIKHGDVDKSNFLVREGRDVVVIDFELSDERSSPQELEDEMDALKRGLEDPF